MPAPVVRTLASAARWLHIREQQGRERKKSHYGWVGLWCLRPLWRSPFFLLRRMRVRLAVMREEAPGCGSFTAGLWCSPLGFVCAFVGVLLVFVGLVYEFIQYTYYCLVEIRQFVILCRAAFC
jgi:hypothetical protein